MDINVPAGLSRGKHFDSGAYTDLTRLSQFKVGGDSDSNIKKVAQEFESVFVNEMMKAMRKANEVFGEDNFMNSNASKTYQDMYDQQLAVTMSKSANGIGLANVLERQLSKMKGGDHRTNPFPQMAAVASNDAAVSRPGAFKAAASQEPNPGRDDSKLLAQRRLTLPPRLTDRLLAGIVPA
ncbi:MAG TPA: rod-binding protein, partial [Pseudomonas sp.]|nr:rod-binding protein [Pseudomonas sp.]